MALKEPMKKRSSFNKWLAESVLPTEATHFAVHRTAEGMHHGRLTLSFTAFMYDKEGILYVYNTDEDGAYGHWGLASRRFTQIPELFTLKKEA